MKTILRWESPPGQMRGPKPRVSDEWGTVAAQLRQHPNRWAVILETVDTSSAANIAAGVKSGRYPSFHPSSSFEAVSRKRGDVSYVYARYVGEGGAA